MDQKNSFPGVAEYGLGVPSLKAFDNGHIVLGKKVPSSSLDEDGYSLYWEGLLFVGGVPCGTESARAFVREVKKSGIQRACGVLKGVFFLLVRENISGASFALVDNSGLYHAFCSDRMISNSFLSLVKKEGLRSEDLDIDSVIEFLHFGYIYFNRTFFGPIRKLESDRIYHVPDGSDKVRVLKKSIPSIDEPIANENGGFLGYMESVSGSLKGSRVSIDLTGGIDSRLLGVVLNYFGLEFEACISGIDACEDIGISEKVARTIRSPWHWLRHWPEGLESDLQDIFLATEGLQDFLTYHRLFQMNQSRLGRGIEVMLSGAGGELYKDFWWLQDFPFYSRKSPDLEKLISYRIMPVEPDHKLLAPGPAERSRALRRELASSLGKFVLGTNTQTYDNIYFHYKVKEVAGRFLTSHSSFLKCFAPYLDPEAVRIGFNLPRRKRFFSYFHRTLITGLNPSAAALPTTEGGISVSSKPACMAGDIYKYAKDKLKRLSIKIAQHSNRAAVQRGPDHPELFGLARRADRTRVSLELLKEKGILNKSLALEEVKDRYLGRMLSLHFLMQYADSDVKAVSAPRKSLPVRLA